MRHAVITNPPSTAIHAGDFDKISPKNEVNLTEKFRVESTVESNRAWLCENSIPAEGY